MALMHGDRPNKHGGGEVRGSRAGWEPEPQHHWQPMHNPDGSQGVLGVLADESGLALMHLAP